LRGTLHRLSRRRRDENHQSGEKDGGNQGAPARRGPPVGGRAEAGP
jgi:hypothetical protein